MKLLKAPTEGEPEFTTLRVRMAEHWCVYFNGDGTRDEYLGPEKDMDIVVHIRRDLDDE